MSPSKQRAFRDDEHLLRNYNVWILLLMRTSTERKREQNVLHVNFNINININSFIHLFVTITMWVQLTPRNTKFIYYSEKNVEPLNKVLHEK